MKTTQWVAGAVCGLCAAAGAAFAADWHVATNGTDAADGASWATAKQTIQAAVDAAAADDTVWVSNGIYDTGGRVAPGSVLSNRVAVTNPIALRSMNGPESAIIDGGNLVRGVYLATNAVLDGFTVAQGYADSGGGVLCADGATVTNCILSNNRAEQGGGIYGGWLSGCRLVGNLAELGSGAYGATLTACELEGNGDRNRLAGGGAFLCTLNGCTLTGNGAGFGGGADSSVLTRCVLTGNTGGDGAGAAHSTLANCLLAGNAAVNSGGGSYDSALVDCTVASNAANYSAGGSHGGALTNCIVYGNTAPRAPNHTNAVFHSSCTTPHPGGTGNIANDPRFLDAAAGNYRLDMDSPCLNAGDNAVVSGPTDLDGNPRIVFGTVDMGAYEYGQLHVATNGSDAASGITWATAKQTIQAAIDAATNGCRVLVSNGVYETGGRAIGIGELTNRVAIDQPVTVQSVNGADVTVIRGQNMGGRIRCAYVGSNAVLSGFTLATGAALGGATNNAGGGVFVAGGTVANCLIGGNVAPEGGGAYIADGGTLSQCRLIDNSAGSAGVGGGVFSSSGGRLQNCLISGNFAEWAPGVYVRGGGMELINCTISGNWSFGGPAVVAPTSTLRNCIVFSNNVNTNDFEIEGDPVVVHSCSPGLSGDGNVTNDPQFADAAAGDYRLQSISSCIDAGGNAFVSGSTDLDGNPRIVHGAVDMGAYEAQLAGAGTWFGAITNGRTNDLDCAAGDGVPNLLKYATGGSPRIADDMMRLGLDTDGPPALVFNRNPNATDVRFTVEAANAVSNGAAWRGIATNSGGSWLGATNVDESGTGNPVVCTVTDPVALESNRFLRLRVSRP